MGEDSSFQLLLVGSGLIIGLAIALGTWNVVSQLEENTLERVVARDLGLTLATVVGMPGDVDIVYVPRSDELRITIRESIVTVYGNTGSSTYRYLRMGGVETLEANVVNRKSIPIRKQGNLLFFEEITEGCDLRYTENTVFLRPRISSIDLPEIASAVQELAESTRHISITDSEDRLIEIQVVKGDVNSVEYFNSDSSLRHRRLACNIIEQGEGFELIPTDQRTLRVMVKEDDPEPIINAIRGMLP